MQRVRGLRLHEDARDEVCVLPRRIVFQLAGARARREACARTKVYLARPWECPRLAVALLLGLAPGDCCQGVVETATVVRPAWERRDGFVREHLRDDSDLVQQDEIPARVGLE